MSWGTLFQVSQLVARILHDPLLFRETKNRWIRPWRPFGADSRRYHFIGYESTWLTILVSLALPEAEP